jgi:hypothetical protein
MVKVKVLINGAWVVADRYHQTDPEALTLWDRPPAKPVRCLGCGLNAEPYEDRCCFLCVCSGQKELAKSAALPHYWDRLVRTGGM